MRELKLRFWSKEHNIWLEPPSITGEPCWTPRSYGNPFPLTDLCNWKITNGLADGTIVIQLYTGLDDNNDKEIFEGDILRCRGYDGWGDTEGFFYNVEVKFDIKESGESDIAGYIRIPKERIIIGNIFENPELANK